MSLQILKAVPGRSGGCGPFLVQDVSNGLRIVYSPWTRSLVLVRATEMEPTIRVGGTAMDAGEIPYNGKRWYRTGGYSLFYSSVAEGWILNPAGDVEEPHYYAAPDNSTVGDGYWTVSPAPTSYPIQSFTLTAGGNASSLGAAPTLALEWDYVFEGARFDNRRNAVRYGYDIFQEATIAGTYTYIGTGERQRDREVSRHGRATFPVAQVATWQ